MNLEFISAALKQIFHFAPRKDADIPDEGPERLRFWAKNARKLADFMETHTIKHNQGMWGAGNPTNPCGTAACALGTAAVYGLVPGLQYTYSAEDLQQAVINPKAQFPIVAVVGGENAEWEEAGEIFFGEKIHWDVFANANLSSTRVIEKLRQHAKQLEEEARDY